MDTYPSEFRPPENTQYALVMDPGVRRDQLVSGGVNQARTWPEMRTEITCQILVPHVDYGRWRAWWDRYAYRWFMMPVALPGSACVQHPVRAASSLSVALVSPDHWMVSVGLEVGRA